MLACAAALAVAAGAHAAPAAPPAAGAGGATQGTPPVIGGGGDGAVANPNPPAAGAQPAAPGAAGELPQVVPGDAAANVAPDAAAPVEAIEVEANQVVAPVDVAPVEGDAVPETARPKPAPIATVDGGGNGDAAPARGGGGTANTPARAYATPNGALPFTGLGQSLLLIVLAGVFVPGGVLLYCAARRGDLRLSRLHLALPRFQWADPAQRTFHGVDAAPDPARCDWLDRSPS